MGLGLGLGFGYKILMPTPQLRANLDIWSNFQMALLRVVTSPGITGLLPPLERLLPVAEVAVAKLMICTHTKRRILSRSTRGRKHHGLSAMLAAARESL